MPNFLGLERAPQQDLAAIEQYVAEHREGWESIKGVLPKVAKLFALYPSEYAEPARLKLSPAYARLANEMYRLYDSEAQCLRYRKGPRKPGKVGCCPYCGIKGSMTVDHYLPRKRSAFPQFSVFSANLVPACYDCQLHKGSYFPRKIGRLLREQEVQRSRRGRRDQGFNLRTSKKRILHPYFDEILSTRILFAEIKLGSDGRPVLANILPRLNLARTIRRSIEFHLERLHVLERAKGEVAHLHNSIVKTMAGNVSTLADVAHSLQTQLGSAEARGDSKNFFDAIYIRALIANTDLHANLLASAVGPRPALIRISRARPMANRGVPLRRITALDR